MGEREDRLRDFERDGLDATKGKIPVQLYIWRTKEATEGGLSRSRHDPDQ
jgi:hypothetical protein